MTQYKSENERADDVSGDGAEDVFSSDKNYSLTIFRDSYVFYILNLKAKEIR